LRKYLGVSGSQRMIRVW